MGLSNVIRPYKGVLPELGRGVYCDEMAVVIGDVVVGDDSSIWPMASVRGDLGRKIRIGARCSIQDNAVLHITHDGPYSPGGADLQIGDDVTVGHGAILHACRIGNACLIGMGSIVLDHAQIEDGCMLAAGSLVPPGRLLRGGWLYRGAPATAARELSPGEREQIPYMAANYVRLKNEYLSST